MLNGGKYMQEFGVIGLSVMGKNLALNIHSKGYSVAGFSIDKPEVDALAKYADDKLKPTYTWEEFVNSLEKPRKILIMIRAGKPVDLTLEKLTKLLEPGDIVIDGGNSNFHDTRCRFHELEKFGLHFIGMGVSGGEEGALHGPALMPGGDEAAFEKVRPILEAIAAKTPEGRPCVSYIGPEASGHYVKMVHNGIEYGIMQLFSEAYDMLRKACGLSNDEMSALFDKWNHEDLQCYLAEITAEVLKKDDDLTSDKVIDHILNEASYKGTGNWTLEDAIVLGAPISVIAEAVLARFMSKATTRAGKEISVDQSKISSDLPELIASALYLGQAVCYAQGFMQLKMAAKAYDWTLRYPGIAQNWEAGCIIRSKTLKDIEDAFEGNPEINNLFEAPFFAKMMQNRLPDLRRVVSVAAENGIPTPTLSAALNYLESIFNPSLPANLIQGQRDYFGAHTYFRNDREGVFHTEWYDEK